MHIPFRSSLLLQHGFYREIATVQSSSHVAIQPVCVHPSSAHRAATFSLPCSGIDRRVPDMTRGTFPPHIAVAAIHCFTQCQRYVFFRAPLCCYLRMGRRKVVISEQCFIVGAIRTTAPHAHTDPYGYLPFMPYGTTPLYFLVISITNNLRGDVSILCWMPCQLRILCGENAVFRQNHLVRAYRTTTSGNVGIDRCHPGMPLFILPPYTAMVCGCDVIGNERTIQDGVPLQRKLWIPGSQTSIICVIWFNYLSCIVHVFT